MNGNLNLNVVVGVQQVSISYGEV